MLDAILNGWTAFIILAIVIAVGGGLIRLLGAVSESNRLAAKREERYRSSQTPPGFRLGSSRGCCNSCIHCKNLIRYDDEGERYCEKYRTDVTVRHTCNSFTSDMDSLISEMAKRIKEGEKSKQRYEINPKAEELYQQAKKCRGQEPEKAFQLTLKSAEDGNTAAMIYLGAAYLHKGRGVPFDPGQSAYWYEKAALAGSPVAMIQLARAYMSGVGKEEDDSKARMWLTKAKAVPGDAHSETAKRAEMWLDIYEDIKHSRKKEMISAIEQGGFSR